MDFLGLQHADAASSTPSTRSSGRRAIDARHRRRSRSTMPKTYQLFSDGQTYGIFQFESSRHARHPAQGQAAAARRPDRAERALPARARCAAGWSTTSSRASRARPRSSTSCPQLEPILARHLRRHRLPGAGDAHRQRCWPASRWARPTCCARRWARRIAEVMAGAARSFVDGRAGEAASTRRRPTKIFDLMEHFAGYGFNKSHSTAYALARVSDGVPQGELPVALRGGAADDRGAEHRQARAVPRRVPRAGRCQCCRRTSTRASCAFTVEPEGVRFGLTRHQERRRGRDRVAARGPRRARAHHLAARAVRGRSTCGSSTSACSRAWSRPARSTRCARAVAGLSLAWRRAQAVRGRRRGRRARRPAPARPRRGQAQLFGGGDDEAAAAASPRCPTRPPWTETEQLALREGDARPLLERPSGRSLSPRTLRAVRRHGRTLAELDRDVRKPTRLRSAASSSGAAAAEDAQGRSHGGLHARGLAAAASKSSCFRRPSRKSAAWSRTARMVLVRGKLERDDESARHRGDRDRAARSAARAARRARWPSGCRPAARTRRRSRRSADVLARHRGDRPRVARRARGATAARRAARCGPTSRAIRVRPVRALVADVSDCGAGLWRRIEATRASPWISDRRRRCHRHCSSSKSRSPSC